MRPQYPVSATFPACARWTPPGNERDAHTDTDYTHTKHKHTHTLRTPLSCYRCTGFVIVRKHPAGARAYSWSTLCVSRWRLCAEQRHAEVWRGGTNKEEPHGIVCPPAPPPPWRHVYGRLHKELHIPTGAFLNPDHLVVGKSVQQVKRFVLDLGLR